MPVHFLENQSSIYFYYTFSLFLIARFYFFQSFFEQLNSFISVSRRKIKFDQIKIIRNIFCYNIVIRIINIVIRIFLYFCNCFRIMNLFIATEESAGLVYYPFTIKFTIPNQLYGLKLILLFSCSKIRLNQRGLTDYNQKSCTSCLIRSVNLSGK